MADRVAFLERVRAAVAAAGRHPPGRAAVTAEPGAAGRATASPPTGLLLARFQAASERVGTQLHQVETWDAAADHVVGLVAASGAGAAAWSREALGRAATVLDRLEAAGIGVVTPGTPGDRGAFREGVAAAGLGITGGDLLVAATGSLVLRSGPGRPRSVSLLPACHVAVVPRSALVPDLTRAGEVLAGWERSPLGSNVVLVTGPSRTADIELTLTRGVHGPREVHVVLVEQDWP